MCIFVVGDVVMGRYKQFYRIMEKHHNLKIATKDNDSVVLVENEGKYYIPNLYGDPDFDGDFRFTVYTTEYDPRWECGKLFTGNLYKQLIKNGGKVTRQDIDCDELDKLLYIAPDAPQTRLFIDTDGEKWVAVWTGNNNRPLFSLSFPSGTLKTNIDASYGLFFAESDTTAYTYDKDAVIGYLNDRGMMPLPYSIEDSVVRENLNDLGDVCDILGVGECFRIVRRTLDKRLSVKNGNGRTAVDTLRRMTKLDSLHNRWRATIWGMGISTADRKSLFPDRLYEKLDDFRNGDCTEDTADNIRYQTWKTYGTQLQEDADAACALIGVKNLDDIKNGKVVDEYPPL